MLMKFEVSHTSGRARRGILEFQRGSVRTPAFMPVGTYGTVKAMTPFEVRETGADIILGNTFHLMLRPGVEVIEGQGGLHGFMRWDRPILTDSGGFQVWSLAERRKISEKGVTFASPVDGSQVFMGPEESMAVQKSLGSDIVMIFDECTPYPASEQQAAESMTLSLRWAERSKRAHEGNSSALFGIVQGGVFEHLRLQSAQGLADIGFDGYAIGGLSVGESFDERNRVLDFTVAALPDDRPRYLMGVMRASSRIPARSTPNAPAAPVKTIPAPTCGISTAAMKSSARG
jgi:queuine tRNA-ribosyltransferase